MNEELSPTKNHVLKTTLEKLSHIVELLENTDCLPSQDLQGNC